MFNRILVLTSILLLSACTGDFDKTNYKSIEINQKNINLPEGLKGCRIFDVVVPSRHGHNINLFITRCKNNDSITTETSEKFPIRNTLIEE